MKRKLIVLSGIVIAAQALVLTAAARHTTPEPHGVGIVVYAEDKGPTVLVR